MTLDELRRRFSARTTVAAMRCRESSHIVPPMAFRVVRPIRPATAQRGVAFSPACCLPWPSGRPRSYRQAPPTNGSGTVDPCLLSMVQASRYRTRQRIKRCIRSRTAASRPHGDEILVWQRPNKPRGMTAEKYQTYPTELVMRQVAIAASENDIEPRKVSLKGAKQAVTAFAPKIEAARPENRAALIDAMLPHNRSKWS